jgi:Flp pilus assembly protein TadB
VGFVAEQRFDGLRGLRRVALALALLVFVAAPTAAIAAPGTQTTAAGNATTTKTTPVAHLTPTISGWLSPGVRLPSRALIVTGDQQVGQLQVTENGNAVRALQVTPLSAPGPGDFGIVVALDTHSTMAATLPVALNAVAALAAERPSHEQLGLITFGSTSQTILPLTDVQSQISGLPTNLSQTGAGADLSAATDAAVSQISAAHLALGALIVLSDGVDLSATRASAARATAAHVPVITIGLQDSDATASSLKALARWAPGDFARATPSTLSTVLGQLVQGLDSRYEVARYRSSASAGTSVDVRLSATGAHGTVAAAYTVPAVRVKRPASSSGQHASAPATAPATGSVLSPSPAWVTDAGGDVTSAPTGFWSSGKAVLVVALFSALLVGVCVLLILKKPSQRAVVTRVGSYIPAESEAHQPETSADDRSTGLLASLQHSSWWLEYLEAVEVSRSARPASWLIRRAAIIALVLAVLVALLLHGVVWGIVPLLVFPLVERWRVMRAAQKQRGMFADTLPTYMQDMAAAIRIGRSFVNAMTLIADDAGEPTRSEFERAVTDESLGRPLEESLSAVGKRMRSSAVDQIALIAELNRRSGSNVAEALDRVAEGARDRAELERELRALTSQAKMSSSVLTGLPIVVLLALTLIAPSYGHPLFHTTLGIILLVVAAVLIFTGWKVMAKISTVKV